MHHSAQKLNALFQISQRIVAKYDLQELLDFIIGRSLKVFGAHTGSLMLIEPLGSRLIMRSVVGLSAGTMRTMKLKVGEGITGTCALHGKPILVRDTSKDPHYVEAAKGTLSELAVPLLYNGKCFGVINLDSDKLANFTKQDMKLLSAFASWAALAIELKRSRGQN